MFSKKQTNSAEAHREERPDENRRDENRPDENRPNPEQTEAVCQNADCKDDTQQEQIDRLRAALEQAEAVVIGAGAGLSTSAGFVYTGPRFEAYFSDFAAQYGFQDMYSGGFYRFATPEEYWAYWSRYIYINRYMDPPKPVYRRLLNLVQKRDYFVLTTNVDHCFQKAGFDKNRLFYTQGDFGLFQCSRPCHRATYDNEEIIRQMVEAQGYVIGQDGDLTLPAGHSLTTRVPAELFPRCPRCGAPMRMNLRSDDTFVEDAGWHKAAARYTEFLQSHQNRRMLFLELAVGFNTPGIIKFSFWQMTAENPQAVYACINYGEALCLEQIADRSICIDGDVGEIISALLK